MILSKRLQCVANFIEQNDYVADVGCDHAYLGIYLKGNNLCKEVIATEVSKGPYNIALNNISESNCDIKLYLTDGLKNVLEPIDTIVFAGMGASTVIGVIDEYKYINNINKIIIQSNNDYEKIRRYIYSIGFFIEKEKYVLDNDKYYAVMLAKKGENQNITEDELILGKFDEDNIPFYKYLLNKYENIIKNIKSKDSINYLKYNKIIDLLKQRIS